MNNIPRGTTSKDLLCSLAEHWRVHAGSQLCYEFILQIVAREPTIHDSKLDDDLSVAIIEFTSTLLWFKTLDRDPNGFPKISTLGTLWRGVDLTSVDEQNRNEFTRAVIAADLVYAETLAEFADTEVNSQDNVGRTVLHWACANQLSQMTAFLLTVPGLDSGLRDHDGFTAFDISCEFVDEDGPKHNVQNEHEEIPNLFYESMIEMDRTNPDGALLRLLTLTTEPDDGPAYPGEALFSPAVHHNLPLVNALMEYGVELTATNEDQETALHLAAKEGQTEIVDALSMNSSRGERFDVGVVAKDGLTALHYAADHGHPQTVQKLLIHGAVRTAQDLFGYTAFDRAVENGQKVVQEILKPIETKQDVPRISGHAAVAAKPSALDRTNTSRGEIETPSTIRRRSEGFGWLYSIRRGSGERTDSCSRVFETD